MKKNKFNNFVLILFYAIALIALIISIMVFINLINMKSDLSELMPKVAQLENNIFNKNNTNSYVNEDYISIIQSQYNNFTSNLTLVITVFSIIITVITIVTPILNYQFTIKDQANKVKELQTETGKALIEYTKFVEAAIGNDDTDIQPISETDKDYAQAKYLSALILLKNEKYSEAIDAITNAIEYISDSKYYFLRAEAYSKLRNYEAAHDDYRRAKNHKDTITYQYAFAQNLLNQDKYKDAIKIYSKLIKISNKAKYFYSRSLAYFKDQDYDKAIEDLDCAIKIDPRNTEYIGQRGMIYFYKKENYEKALEDYNKAVQYKGSASYFSRRGTVKYLRGNDNRGALEDASIAIKLQPGKALYWINRGIIYHRLKNYDQALSDKNMAVNLEPENADFLHSRAETFLCLKRYEDALKDVLAALDRRNSNKFSDTLSRIKELQNKKI